MIVRDLYSLDDFADVVDLQKRVWGIGYDDVVPLSIFAVVVKRGGILIGAFDEAAKTEAGRPRMAAFVFSLPGIKDGRAMQWSHMLGVDEDYRRSGIGCRLKLAQRDRTLAQRLELIEWTYDPLQAANAHLNFARLGVIAENYLENVYGMSGSQLHQGAPTDRFIAAWKIATPHVERRIAREAAAIPLVRDASLAEVATLNATRSDGAWLAPDGEPDLDRDERRLFVEIPIGFGDMLQQAPDLALAWRMSTRRIFQTYFSRGYGCVDFLLDRANGRGRYLLVKREEDCFPPR
jgi:predicted GNAT superfamily acetyltransferase